MDIKHPIILVTGANRGLGLEFCRQLSPSGATIWAAYRGETPGVPLLNLQEQAPDQVRPLRLDVTMVRDMEQAAEIIARESGRLDLLINNAGYFPRGETPASLDEEIIMKTLRINSVGPLMLAQAMLPLLRRGHSPKIINITSQLGSLERKRSGGNYSYAASKAALNMFTRVLAADLHQDKIIVLAVHPGWVNTDMGGQGAPLTPAESVSGMLALIHRLTQADSGTFLTWNGQTHPW